MSRAKPIANGIGKSKQQQQPKVGFILPKKATQPNVKVSGGPSTKTGGSRIMATKIVQIPIMQPLKRFPNLLALPSNYGHARPK